MAIAKHLYERSLERFYDAIDKNYEHRINTKKWCLTLWLATIAFISESEQSLSFFTALSLSSVPIVAFWFLEATQGAYGKVLIDRAIEMEGLMARDWNGIESPERYFYLSGRHAQMGVKVRATLYAGLAMETVVTFYVVLLGLSPALIYFMRS